MFDFVVWFGLVCFISVFGYSWFCVLWLLGAFWLVDLTWLFGCFVVYLIHVCCWSWISGCCIDLFVCWFGFVVGVVLAWFAFWFGVGWCGLMGVVGW